MGGASVNTESVLFFENILSGLPEKGSSNQNSIKGYLWVVAHPQNSY